jgi:dipeptidyl aminopeptidase/acylaminoacyl peptidase
MRLLLFLAVAAFCHAQVPTIEQSLSMETAGSARISPDGKFVAYTKTKADWDENANVTQLWVYMTSTGEHYQLTHGKKSASPAEWSPDSRWIAFTSDRDGKSQLYLISPSGGEARQLTKFDADISSLKWSPDGKSIAIVSSGPQGKEKKERKDKYGEFEIVGGDYTMSHLWLVKFDEKAAQLTPEALTTGDRYTVGRFAWSPDGTRIAFSATTTPDLSDSGTSDIYVVQLADKSVKKIVDLPGPDGDPVWSPDGTHIAFVSADSSEFHFYTNAVISVVPASGGAVKVVGRKFDENPNIVAWTQAGIYFEGMARTAAHLFRLSPESGNFERVSAPADLIGNGFTFTRDYRSVAFACARPNQYGEICTSPVGGFTAKVVTNLGDQLKPFKTATREVFEWKSKDGTPIEGILIKPANFDPTKKYPLLVVIHGGPTGIDRPWITPDRTYPVERFAAKGAVILRPNYRGSAGYGEKFRSLNVRNLGLGDHDDVVSGVDALIAKGYIDRDRVASMGWSQGGYISAFLTTYSDRFRAVSVGAGISNWMTYYVNTDIHPFTRQYLKATPWDDPEIYRKTSPMTYINRAKTPTLIQHGELDKRVPIPNAYELYQGLQDRKVPSRLVVYKGFGHGITKPKQMRHVMEDNEAWFGKWIWGEERASGSFE